MPVELPPLRSERLAHAEIELGPIRSLGPGPGGERRIVEITGGRVTGDVLAGTVLTGGADWQTLLPDGTVEVEARYGIETATGALVLVRSAGVRTGPPEVLAALQAGEDVDPAAYRFRTHVRLEADDPELAWLRRTLCIAVAARLADAVVYDLHEIR